MLRVLTEEELDQIRKRDQARTPGEWMWDSYSGIMVRVPKDHFLNYSFPDEPPIGYIAWIDGGQGQQGDELQNPEAKANADFIASNSLDVPNLLTTIKAKEQELIETRGQRDRAQNKLDEIRRQEAALPGTTELQRHIRELERMIPELQRRQKRHIEHIAGLERNNHELREQLTQLKGMSKKINQTKNYMKSPEEIMREVDDSYKRDSLKYSDLFLKPEEDDD